MSEWVSEWVREQMRQVKIKIRERERERNLLPRIKKISPRYEFLKLAWMGKRRSYGYHHRKKFSLSSLSLFTPKKIKWKYTLGYNFLKSMLSTHSKTREGVFDWGSWHLSNNVITFGPLHKFSNILISRLILLIRTGFKIFTTQNSWVLVSIALNTSEYFPLPIFVINW